MVEDLVLNHNLSIMATDTDTNTPLAVVLNGVMGENEALVPRSEASIKQNVLDCGSYKQVKGYHFDFLWHQGNE